jgi:two-component system chemotaxis response regulator CheY
MAKILVVDDSTSIRQLATFTLKTSGHTIVEADDGSTASKKSDAEAFDVIITDQNMPKMSGIDFAKHVRKGGPNRHTPILMLTTESDQSKKMEGKAAGVSGWIVKPFKPEQLLSAISRLTS